MCWTVLNPILVVLAISLETEAVRQSKLSAGVNGLLYFQPFSRKHTQCFSLVDIDPHRSETTAEDFIYF